MLRTWITLILFGLFVLEGAVMPWLLPEMWLDSIMIRPHLVFVVILYISIYLNRHIALGFGLGFGLLQDFIYLGPMIGTHSFNFGLTSYLIGLIFQGVHIRLVSSLFFIAVGNFMFECIHYGLYRMFELISISFQYALLHQMIPSVLFNLLFALIIYVPFRKIVESMNAHQEHESE